MLCLDPAPAKGPKESALLYVKGAKDCAPDRSKQAGQLPFFGRSL